jgi:hypothetical protein
MTPLDKMTQYLREEYRMKVNTDYAIAYKYGKAHIISNTLWADYIKEAADRFGIEIASMSLYQ